MINVEHIRKNFPVLETQVNQHPLVYLDNAATTLKPLAVNKLISQYNTQTTANVHRGLHFLSETCTYQYENVRDELVKLIGAKKREEIIFTKGTTESLNLIARSYGAHFLKAGDQVLISHMEHHSNIVPWQILKKSIDIELKVIPIDDRGEIIYDEYLKLLSEKTKIISIVAISNSLGTINPIAQMIQDARKKTDAVFIVDGAQLMAHDRVDVTKLDIDFLAFSGHKIFGPTGVGVLFGKERLLESMPPFLGGGDMIDQVTFEETTFNDLPYKFEAGTPAIASVIGLQGAIDFLNTLDFGSVKQYEYELLSYLQEQTKEIVGIREIGTALNKSSIFSFHFDDIHPQDIATYLDKFGIAIRTGHHCTQPVMKHFSVPATSRASLSIYNTKEEIDTFVYHLNKLVELFRL